MTRIAGHIKLLASLAALLFGLGSSGLAAVIDGCAMTPQMACCKTMHNDPMAGCDIPAGAASGVSVQNDMSCHTSTLVGGHLTNPGVIETGHTIQKISLAVEPVAACASCMPTPANSLSPRLSANGISPPSVKKHILNVSLLI